jgi:DNA-binding protein HU-beta
MTKAELIHNVTKKAVAHLIEATFDEMGGYFVRVKVTRKTQPRFTFPGFGTFTKKRREQRQARNPRTGELIKVPANTTITFTPGQELRAQLNDRA